MANEKKIESKYGLKRAARFGSGGRTFRSLGEGEFAAPTNPTPRPLDMAYFPKHTPKFVFGMDHSPMKHEDIKMVQRFRNKDFVYPKPKWLKPERMKKQAEKVVKYDHFQMNYHGWND